MNQLSLDLKFPWEAEQIALDLDFKPCQDYVLSHNLGAWTTVISTNTVTGKISWDQIDISTITFQSSNSSVGYWAVGEGMQMHNKIKPSWLHQKMTKIFFGWIWKDK